MGSNIKDIELQKAESSATRLPIVIADDIATLTKKRLMAIAWCKSHHYHLSSQLKSWLNSGRQVLKVTEFGLIFPGELAAIV